MGKYFVVFRVSLAERLVYRADFFLSTFLRFIPIVTTILLWRAIYDGAKQTEIGGLHYNQMVSYYLLIMIVRAFGSMPKLASGIALAIREGELRKYILQPIDYLTYLLMLRCAHKLVYFVMSAIPYAIIFWLCSDYLPGWPGPAMFCLSVLTLLMTFFIGFAINSLLGLLGFWFLEVATFIHAFMTLQYFLSGHMFPLSLLPKSVEKIVTLLPFAYETYYPVLILLQKVSVEEAVRIIVVQFVWGSIVAGLCLFAWKRGLHQYAAFGG